MFRDKYRSDNEKIAPDEGLLKYLARQMEDAGDRKQASLSAPAAPKRPWIHRHIRPVLALAACFAVTVTGLALYRAVWAPPGKTASPVVSETRTGRTLSGLSYTDIYTLVKSMETKAKKDSKKKDSNGYLDTAAVGTATAEMAASYSRTNVQVEGVDEADIVKTDGKYIYALSGNVVVITDVQGGTMKTASRISVSSTNKAREGRYARELFVQDDRLILLESVYETNSGSSGGTYAEKNALIDYAYGDGSRETAAAIYDIGDRAHPKLLNTVGQSGYYLSSRIAGGKLYLITNYSLGETAVKGKPETFVPILYAGDTGSAMAAGDISIGANPKGRQYVVVTAVDVKQPSGVLSSKSVYGCGSAVYADAQNLLIASSVTVETGRTSVSGATADGKSAGNAGADAKANVRVAYSSQTNLIRFSLNGGIIAMEATGSVPGFLLNQYSMDECNGVFRLVTTVNSYTETYCGSGSEATVSYSASGNQSSALYTLGQNLKILGSIADVAPGERVYSVRFAGTVGCFVTFRQVDPLFAVDLSNPSKPKILSELKIPGLSDYLHPYADGLLFGLGRDADAKTGRVNGLKLSMFDVSDPSNVTEKQKLLLNAQWSEASYNPKAILVSPQRGLIAFPADNNRYLVYSYSAEKGFVEKASFEADADSGSQIRGVYIDDRFYVCSDASITAYSMKDYSMMGKLNY